MTLKYCPHCNRIGHTRTMAYYKQVLWKGIMVKQRRIVHMVEEGGCGLTWYTAELPFDMLEFDDENMESGHGEDDGG